MRLKLFEGFDDFVEINNFLWNPKRRSFSVEISELDGKVEPAQKVISIKNNKTGNSVDFTFVKADKDGSDEDTYGWRYENKEKKLTLLIIND